MCKIVLKLSVILCAVLFFCGAGCEKMANAVWGIWVENNSDKDVYFVVGFDLINGNFYPTTQWPNDSIRLRRVRAHQSNPLDYAPRSAVKFNSGDLIAIFVLDPDTVAKYTWEQLGANENYLKKYIFTGGSIGAPPSNPITYP